MWTRGRTCTDADAAGLRADAVARAVELRIAAWLGCIESGFDQLYRPRVGYHGSAEGEEAADSGVDQPYPQQLAIAALTEQREVEQDHRHRGDQADAERVVALLPIGRQKPDGYDPQDQDRRLMAQLD